MKNGVTVKALRDALRNKYGARKYKITAAGDVCVLGYMPNTSTRGWYLLGDVDDSILHHDLGLVGFEKRV